MQPFHGPISELVPHRGSMLLLDRLLLDEPLRVRVAATVRRGALFTTGEGLPAWVGVELMAQAVAAWAGLRARERGEPVPMGFLLGTRRYACAVPHFGPGARLEVEAEQELAAANGMVVFACRIEREGQVLATANLNVFEPEDVEAYLEGARRDG
jgi:predicted hotdog family 3-hydroxylacyl-ACP dehydratase